jgi:hypothetical protein
MIKGKNTFLRKSNLGLHELATHYRFADEKDRKTRQ